MPTATLLDKYRFSYRSRTEDGDKQIASGSVYLGLLEVAMLWHAKPFGKPREWQAQITIGRSRHRLSASTHEQLMHCIAAYVCGLLELE